MMLLLAVAVSLWVVTAATVFAMCRMAKIGGEQNEEETRCQT